jgi:hypothetical protein
MLFCYPHVSATSPVERESATTHFHLYLFDSRKIRDAFRVPKFTVDFSDGSFSFVQSLSAFLFMNLTIFNEAFYESYSFPLHI